MNVREFMREGQGEGKEYVRGPKSENEGRVKRKDRVGTGMEEAKSVRGTRLLIETRSNVKLRKSNGSGES